MNLKVNLNFRAVSLKDISLPTGNIKAGEPFELVDAYKEGQAVVIGINLYGIQEALFRIPKGARIKNSKDLREFVSSFIYPYHQNATYTVLRGNVQ